MAVCVDAEGKLGLRSAHVPKVPRSAGQSWVGGEVGGPQPPSVLLPQALCVLGEGCVRTRTILYTLSQTHIL